MGKNKRKSQNNEVQIPKKIKTDDVQKKNPKNQQTFTDNSPKANKKELPKPNKKLQKFSGTSTLKDNQKQKNNKSDDESDYEVEKEIKPEKVTMTMNEANVDSEDENEISEEEDISLDNIEVENENNENTEKFQKKNKKNNDGKANTSNTGNVLNTEKIKSLIQNESKKAKNRYVLFVGNLPYGVTESEIKEHFQNVCSITSVRIPKHKEGNKPRGFGYIDVADEESYLKALSKHHSFLKGRRINVMYTLSGKKKPEAAKKLIKSKNLKLTALRREGKLGSMKHSNKRSVRRAKKRQFEKKTEQ